MVFDEVLMRDSCAKSRSKIKKYFYYNEYSKNNFNFKSDFEELTLLDMIEGTKTIIDVLPTIVPYLLIIILAIICIGVWISICCCSCRPKCFLKKNIKYINQVRFICFMVFLGFSVSIIVLGIVLLVYISYAEGDFNGSICSLLMFQYEIINGQGLLSKDKLYKPYWYGSTQIGNEIQKINNLIESIKATCIGSISNLQETFTRSTQAGDKLIRGLQKIYEEYYNKDISITNPSDPHGPQIETIPIYTSNLGPKENNETYTGRVLDSYNKNFKYILDDIITPVTGLCTTLSNGGDSLEIGLGGFESIISTLNSLLENLSSTIITYITKYSNYIINFGYKVNFTLFTIITTAMVIECILFILYYFHPFSKIKCNIYIFISLINLILILCIIYNGIFGILSLFLGNMADIVDAVLSKENLGSENPRLINGGNEIKKLARCLRGDGNLFDEFVDEDVKSIVDPLTKLYTLYTPVKTVFEKLNNPEQNEYNTLLALDKVIKEFKNMKDDFLLTTTKETSGDNDINTMLDELAKYTMAGRKYQIQCVSATYDIWTTNSNHCPKIQADNNIITGECKYLETYFRTDGPTDASEMYNTACNLINNPPNTFSTVKEAVEAYINSLYLYHNKNIQLIDNILNGVGIDTNEGFNQLYSNFQEEFIGRIIEVMPIINNDITGKVYALFSELLNDTTKDTSKLNSENFNLFSWMNCSAIGQDYNATLSTLKSSLAYEMKVITICSLICEFLLIANLYIMVGLAKNLRDKVFEINDSRNVSHSSDNIEEIEVKSIKDIKNSKEDDEIYAIRNKKKFIVEENIDKKRGINIKENLNKDGNGIEHPALVSINGPDGRCLFENGENAHKKIESNKRQLKINNFYNSKNKETEDGNSILNTNDKLNVKESKTIHSKNIPKKKKDIISVDSDEEGNSKKTKITKNKNNKSEIKIKSSKSIKLDDKKSASSSSVSFG